MQLPNLNKDIALAKEMVFIAEAEGIIINPIAICPQFTEKEFSWNDTSDGFWGQCLSLKSSIEIKKRDGEIYQIKLKDDYNHQYTLTRLTLDLFKEKVLNKVAGGEQLLKQCQDDESQLINYYKNKNFLEY